MEYTLKDDFTEGTLKVREFWPSVQGHLTAHVYSSDIGEAGPDNEADGTQGTAEN